MTGSEMVIKALLDQGIDVVFGYPGGAVLPIYDALFQQNELQAHPGAPRAGGAVHAAEGYARSTGKVGAVLVTSGPGATNAVTGLTDALMDSMPVICLTGQVPTHLIGNDAFQEADTTGITRPCTKHNYWSSRSRTCRASCTRPSTWPRTAGPARWWSTCPRTCCRPRATAIVGPEAVSTAAYNPHQGRSRAMIEAGGGDDRRKPSGRSSIPAAG